MKAEINRRSGSTARVIALFRSRPQVWIPWTELAEVGGACSWRTRISEGRRIVQRDGEDIVWNKSVKASAYMLKPQPLGRDAATPVTQASLW